MKRTRWQRPPVRFQVFFRTRKQMQRERDRAHYHGLLAGLERGMQLPQDTDHQEMAYREGYEQGLRIRESLYEMTLSKRK